MESLSILEQLNEGKEIQQNAAYVMNFMVQDLLDYAQIKAGKFRQNYQNFDIREAVKKVMSVLG